MKPRITRGGPSWWLILPTGQDYGRRQHWQPHPTWQAALDACRAWYTRLSEISRCDAGR